MYLRIGFLALLCLPVLYIIYLLFNYLYQDIKKEKGENRIEKPAKTNYYEDDIYVEYQSMKNKYDNRD